MVAITIAAAVPGVALADPGDDAPNVTITAPARASLGDTVTVQARVTAHDGKPLSGIAVTFASPVTWSEDIAGDMEVGSARTDASGLASISYEMRRAGDITIIARATDRDGKEVANARSSLSVSGETQLYLPQVGIKVWGLGSWLIALALGFVWALYFVVATRVLAISRSPGSAVAHRTATAGPASVERRHFLAQSLVPLGMVGLVTVLGSGLMTIVARAPYTHGNLKRYTTLSNYRRTPFARIGEDVEMRELPPLLDREVSFAREVMPILRARGGPHFVTPVSSPSPGGVRFDSYGALMSKEMLVVPGKPDESMLVKVLLEKAMGMPPAGEPLPDEELQVIASWIAQGARDT